MMKPQRKKRLFAIIAILIGASSAASLAIYALGQNINLYYTPSQISAHQESNGRIFRVGGLVEKGSVKHAADSLQVSFVLTDYHQELKVYYTGVLPVLFREGQGIVVQGKFNKKGQFIADQVLAKHDENYKPPGIQK